MVRWDGFEWRKVRRNNDKDVCAFFFSIHLVNNIRKEIARKW